MTKLPPPVGSHTRADALRDDLSQCERWVIQIGQEADGLTLLRTLDRIADELDALEALGADVRAERSRFESVLAQLRHRAGPLVAQLGPRLAAERPPDARWWWHLDAHLTTRRRRRLKRLLAAAIAGGLLLALGYLLYDKVLAPPPQVRLAYQRMRDGEDAALAGEWEQAIADMEAVVALDPQRAEAYLWLGLLYARTGEAARSEAAFEQARSLMADEVYLMYQRGAFQLALGDTQAARKDALALIELAPDRPEGYLLLGDVAERQGDLDLAIASFQKASEVAEAVGAVEIQALARVRLATALQLRMAHPEP